MRSTVNDASRSHLHLVDDAVGAQDVEPGLGVLLVVGLQPCCLPAGRQTHHHDDLGRRTQVTTISMYEPPDHRNLYRTTAGLEPQCTVRSKLFPWCNFRTNVIIWVLNELFLPWHTVGGLKTYSILIMELVESRSPWQTIGKKVSRQNL